MRLRRTRRTARFGVRIKALGALAGTLTLLALALPSFAAHAAAQAPRVIHVAKNGSDSNPGTQAAPYLTINHAAQEAQPGDTVMVHAGLYRETVKPARGGTDEAHRITYTNAGDGEVVVKGSEEVNSWTQTGGNVWSVTLPNSYFGDYNPYATGQPQGGDGGTFPGYTAGDVYLNEQAYYEKPSLSAVQGSASSWYSEVSTSSTTIWANFNGADPNAGLAEINVRRQIFAPDAWGLGYITVNGFTVKQAANTYSDFPSSPTRRQAGAISVNGGLKWIIENNIVINARTIGIDIGLGNDEWAGNRPGTTRTDFHDTDKYGSHIVRNNYIARCGQSGIAGVFSWHSQILYNMIEDTNYRNEFSGAETAPIKVHYMNEGLIKGNYIKNSKGGNSAGIWTDWGNQNVRITQNIVMNSPWGYYAEAVFGPILVDNNVFIGNSDIRTLDATGVVFAHNLFIDNGSIHNDGSGRDAYYFQPGTMNQTTALTSPEKFFWYNNLVQGSTLPDNATDKTQVKEGDFTGVISNVHYTATNTQMSLNFDLDASGIHGLTPVTQSRVGVIPLADQSIAADVTTDFFGQPVNTSNVMAGPFAAAHSGTNSFTLWPPAGQTVPKPPTNLPVNLSLNPGTKAVASYQDGAYTAANAIDGNASSRWSSDHSNDPNAWIHVDLGGEYNVSTAVLSWEAAYGSAYKIQVSDDATHWTDAYSTTSGLGGNETVTVNKAARYVRMQGVTPATQYGYSLWEFEIYGTPASGGGSGAPTVYGDSNYSGPSATFPAGSYDLPQLQAAGIANDSISSLRVPAGWTVTAYADAGFSGTQWTFTADAPDLTATGNNDKISSLRVTAA
ncbi:galactose-binding domain-containing protein [Actinacidiphila acididurans]|uniref:Discoidin domain-containing protein n=1 Tax=Actinacidiphila acididurans TaxID=2784346 RepID=A0ABS2TLJ2_9ACTN|nr:discoidin domain-containing protein [Actinacidiphila acididurans]MBM9504209.1 discoidin domain-containing protein [Actinacidiphila acididurans]